MKTTKKAERTGSALVERSNEPPNPEQTVDRLLREKNSAKGIMEFEKLLAGKLILPQDMPKDAAGKVVQMTVDELRCRLPDLRYEGEKKNGVPNGIGRLSNPSGWVWSGEFVNGRLTHGVLKMGKIHHEGDFLNLWGHGTGTTTFPDGREQSGTFRYSEIVEGRVTIPGVSSYEGPFRCGRAHGMGKLTDLRGSGRIWEGFFENGSLRTGKITDRDGSFDEGTFCDHVLHGNGRSVYPNGAEYNGSFKHGKRHGVGSYIDPANDHICEGEWHDNECVYGKLTIHGNQYEGPMANGDPHGSGRFTMGHGVLEATFDGLVVHGECKLTTARGDWVKMFIRKSGEIELCSLYCAGYELVPSSEDTVRATLKFPNGSKYVGALLVARAVGIGELTIPGLGICKGSFFNGFLNGKAGVRFSGGGTLNGTFDGGLLEGPGEYRSGNGTVYIGNFMDGLPCGPGAVFVPGDKADLYLTIKGGEKPSCPEFDETELMSLREALAHFCVAFPAQVVMGVTKVKGKGLFISSVISDALPDGGEPFSVVEVPADDSTANADEAKAA